jgi:hypothetical protein
VPDVSSLGREHEVSHGPFERHLVVSQH